MLNEGVDMLLMTSAVKVGSQGAVKFDGESINAPFNKYWTTEAETVNGDYRAFEKSWNHARSFTLSVTWRFGSLKASVKKAEHSIDNDDVVGGISKGT